MGEHLRSEVVAPPEAARPTCEHCGEPFDWPEYHPNAIPKRFCSETCRTKRKRNRWVLKRQRKRRVLSRQECPTPEKWLWFSEAEARSHSEKFGNRIYRCRGTYPHFHVTSQGARTANNRLDDVSR